MSTSHDSVAAALAGIWSDVLGVGEIAPGQDFFALGGTSLHAARVLTKTRAAFGVKLSPQDLFDHPTLGGFSARVAAAGAPEAPG
jgi:acyl carrier protein